MRKKIKQIAVKEIMRKPVITLHEQVSVRAAIPSFSSFNVHIIPIVDEENRLKGVITAEHLLEYLLRDFDLDIPVSDCFDNRSLKIVELDARIKPDEVGRYELICVTQEEHLEGVIEASSILDWYSWKSGLLRQTEEKCREYEMIVNHYYDSIYEIDAEGIILMANPATRRITGKTPDELIGRNIKEIEQEKIYFPSVVNSVWETKKTTTIIQNVEGERKALVTGVPIFNEEGCIERIITATRDLKVLIEEVEKNPMQQEIDSLVNRLQRTESLVEKYFAELRQLRKEKTEEKRITSKNKEMRLVLELAKKVAPVDSNVLILGESGTGKDLLANMIHNMSRRCSGPFIKVNCGAIPENILESELFGYEEGAFTGAQKNGKAGLLEIADGGTIFLNEIGEMPYQLQVKLLQAIQDRSFIRLGGCEPKVVDIRIIAATNKDLRIAVEQGEFREDLFYRLNVIPMTIPPLRERKEDIPALVFDFLKQFNEKYRRNKHISSRTMELLLNHEWPGNVRELENLIERLVVVSKEDTIYPDDLPFELLLKAGRRDGPHIRITEGEGLQETLDKVEKNILCELYQKYKSTNKLAELLKINQSTVVRKLNKYGITEK
ncbi:sigma 54-interacting transcriptional regulator [Zhenpiania hominis]|uniref:sigma 54-interacting transcriptional regulator n=1 Tax=Zhenpiania hominis TaxID=2763644 RepID=UPI0039F5DBF5